MLEETKKSNLKSNRNSKNGVLHYIVILLVFYSRGSVNHLVVDSAKIKKDRVTPWIKSSCKQYQTCCNTQKA